MKNFTPNETTRRDNRIVNDLNRTRREDTKKFKRDRRTDRGQKTINQDLAWVD